MNKSKENISQNTNIKKTIQNEEILSNFGAKDIIELKIFGKRLEEISVNKIFLNDSIVDENHSNELRNSMNGERKQITPITVRARLRDGEIVYDIIDGFHRCSAKKRDSELSGVDQLLVAVVLYGCSDEEMFDLRVLAANSVRSVSFPRIVTWMQRSFEQTKWYEKGLTLSQIVSMAYRKETEKSNLGLSNEEITQAKEWVVSKAKKWNQTLSTLYNNTKSTENADPELIKRVRIGSGGKHDKRGTLNPAKLKAITDELPGEYILQNIVADIVCAKNLDRKQTSLISRAVAKERDNPENLQLIRENPLISIGVLEIDKDKEEETDDENEENELFIKTNHKSFTHRSENSTSNVYDIKKTPAELVDEINNLNKSISVLQKQLESSGSGGNPLWFESIPDLSKEEREVSRLFFKEIQNVDDISEKLNILPHKVLQYLQSICIKYQIYKSDMAIDIYCEQIKIRARV